MIVFPDKPAPVIKHFLDQNKPLVYKYIVKKIKHAINSNLESVDVFRHHNKVETIKQQDFEKMLDHAIVEFCKIEDYETAAITKKLMDKLKINKLIDDSKSN